MMAQINTPLSSPLAERLHNTGLGQIDSIGLTHETDMQYLPRGTHTPYTTQVEYRITLFNSSITDIDAFENALLFDPAFDRMKRIIESNPELKDLYEKYETLDALSGNK